ncbi:hypothetical protein JVX93_19325 [Mycolicibacterium boenickei]|nr:hypothetical protein JVX93_19325 [Mycolicibacterium boenickei]
MAVDVATPDQLNPTDDFEVEVDAAGDCEDEQPSETEKRSRWRMRPPSTQLLGLVMVVVIAVFGGLAGWFGYRTFQAREVSRTNDLLLQAGRQAAINLTTIDAATVDADIRRVLDASVDPFASEFSKRSTGFADVVRLAQSKSEGRVTEAAIESMTDDAAEVLVAMSVVTTMKGVPEDHPRLWRMRITVKKAGDTAKVSNVGFVS